MIETAMEQQSPGQGTPAWERLRAAVVAERAAQAAQAVAIYELGREHDWWSGDEFEVVGRRLVRIGADETPLVDETLPLEIAALTGTSVTAATALIRDIMNLQYKHEYAWQAVVEARVPVWRARQLTQVAEAFGLGVGECMVVDARVQPLLGAVGWDRVMARYRAAIIDAAPGKVAAYNESRRRNRHVTFGTDAEDPALSWMSALADTSDVKAFEHLLELVTKALIGLGDTDPVDVVRSKALGRMADPEGVLALLDGVDDDGWDALLSEKKTRRRHAPVAQVFVHVAADTLEDGGPARIERLGPVLVDDLSRVVGHHRIKLTPVLHADGAREPVVDGYEVPDNMRERVHVRDRYEVFPYSCREARGLDMDHTIPYVEGASGQTRPSNLGPLSRRAHRGKTHGGWRLEQPRPGVFWWYSPRGQVFRLSSQGTWNLTSDGSRRFIIERQRLWELDKRLGEASRAGRPREAPARERAAPAPEIDDSG